LVFSINTITLDFKQTNYPMSRELIEITEQIDEQFEIEEINLTDDEFWQSVLNLFI